MATVNRITTALFDTLFAVMESWPGWLSLVVLSALTGIIALLVYKYTSNQTAIGRVHDDIRVALLAAKLFKDDLGVTLRSQGKLFGAATRLFLYSLVPLAVMTPPMILLLTQMAPRYEWQPFRPGDEVKVEVTLRDGTAKELAGVELDAPAGVELLANPDATGDVEPVGKPRRYFAKRYKDFPEKNSLLWHVRVNEPGRHRLEIAVEGEKVIKELTVSDNPHARTSPIRAGASFAEQLLYAVEPPAGKDDVIQTITLEPIRPGKMSLFGLELHWVIWWLILSMAIALLVKPLIKVQMW
jgi:uncharacterized membrane protein (DUF106 family)